MYRARVDGPDINTFWDRWFHAEELFFKVLLVVVRRETDNNVLCLANRKGELAFRKVGGIGYQFDQ